jgi:hypothetical protein
MNEEYESLNELLDGNQAGFEIHYDRRSTKLSIYAGQWGNWTALGESFFPASGRAPAG